MPPTRTGPPDSVGVESDCMAPSQIQIPSPQMQVLQGLLQKIPRNKKNSLLWISNLKETVRFLQEFRSVSQQTKVDPRDLAVDLGVDPDGVQYLLAGKNTMGKPNLKLSEMLEGKTHLNPQREKDQLSKLLMKLQSQLDKARTEDNPHIREASVAYYKERIRLLKEEKIRKLVWTAPQAREKYARLAEQLARECLAFGSYKDFMASTPCFSNMSPKTDLREIWPNLRWENSPPNRPEKPLEPFKEGPETGPPAVIKVTSGGTLYEIPLGTPNLKEVLAHLRSK